MRLRVFLLIVITMVTSAIISNVVSNHKPIRWSSEVTVLKGQVGQ